MKTQGAVGAYFTKTNKPGNGLRILMKQSPPRRHHYIPQFYLKRWVKSDGRLYQFKRDHGQIWKKEVFPAATGYMDKLYGMQGVAEEDAQFFETAFFKPVDDLAADALTLMEKHGNSVQWDTKHRSAWSRFIFSLLMRCPEDIELFKRTWKHQLPNEDAVEWEARYQEVRGLNHTGSFQSFIESLPAGSLEFSSMKSFIRLIDDESIGQKINDMHWHIMDTSGAGYDLLSSDRPVIMTNGLLIPQGHIALPIGPKRLFIASHNKNVIREIVNTPLNKIVKESNENVTEYAQRFVYANSDTQIRFIQNRMSTKKRERLIEILARKKALPEQPET